MPASIFSTYSAGENRVTASILAVLRSLAINRIERLLGALMEQSEFELVRFENQVAEGGGGVPDAVIASNIRIFVETKIKRNAVDADQLRRHVKRLKEAKESNRVLLVLTPDDQRPKEVAQIADKAVIWSSFSVLDQAIEELLADKAEAVAEREVFLLRELQTMLLEEGLIGSASEVLVVPARQAWPEYQAVHAYICQPNRPFQPVKRLAFYYSGEIQQVVPTILETWHSVRFEHGKESGWLGELIERLLKEENQDEGMSYKVMKLSAPDDPSTLRLGAPISNNLKSDSGRPVAFTQNQRYVSLEKLKKAKFTSELVDALCSQR